ncbi:MAG: divalent-cation tolerance protein CutA [Xanthomonadales bacterium]|nr:divalent-cation tolerance protein CutA [Gammaproteobacteria bacterium]NNE04691.1 divalent-cation tolerance protein CutA [Xanthomonadales bacterium]NNL96064.1 divalent-cation tolerance protein CutA [Xanthomonadales bacterium]
MSELMIVLCTCPDEETALRLSSGLVEAELVACVNILPAVRSIYRWQGSIQNDAELLLIAKTVASQFGNVERWLAEHHPYDVPEVVGLPAGGVSGAYMHWVEDSVSQENRH